MSPSLLPQSRWALGRSLRRPLNYDPQEAGRLGAPGSERILLDILEHDWREAQDSRQELCQKLHAVQGELQWAEELRDKVASTSRPTLPLPGPCPVPASSLLTDQLLGRAGGRVGITFSDIYRAPGAYRAKKGALVCSQILRSLANRTKASAPAEAKS